LVLCFRQADEVGDGGSAAVSPSPRDDYDDQTYLARDDTSDDDDDSNCDETQRDAEANDSDSFVDLELVVRGTSWKDATKETISALRREFTPAGLVSVVHQQEDLASVDAKDVFLLPATERKNFGCIPLSQGAIDRQLDNMKTKNKGLRKGTKPYVLRIAVVRGKAAAAEEKATKEREKKEKKEKAKDVKGKNKAAKAKDNEHQDYLNQLIAKHGIHPFGGRYSQAKLQIWAEAIVNGKATLVTPPANLVPDNLSKEERLAQTVAAAVSDVIEAHSPHAHPHSQSPPRETAPSPSHTHAHSRSHARTAASSDTSADDVPARAESAAVRVKREQSEHRHPPANDVIFKVAGSRSFPTPAAVPISAAATVHDLLLSVIATHAQLGADAQESFFVGVGLPSGHVLSPSTPLSKLLDDGGLQKEPLSLIERSFDLTITATDQTNVIPPATTRLTVPFASLASSCLWDLLQQLARQVLPSGRTLLAAALADGTNVNALMWHSANVLVAQKWNHLCFWY